MKRILALAFCLSLMIGGTARAGELEGPIIDHHEGIKIFRLIDEYDYKQDAKESEDEYISRITEKESEYVDLFLELFDITATEGKDGGVLIVPTPYDTPKGADEDRRYAPYIFGVQDGIQYVIGVDNISSWERRGQFGVKLPASLGLSEEELEDVRMVAMFDLSASYDPEEEAFKLMSRHMNGKEPVRVMYMDIWALYLLHGETGEVLAGRNLLEEYDDADKDDSDSPTVWRQDDLFALMDYLENEFELTARAGESAEDFASRFAEKEMEYEDMIIRLPSFSSDSSGKDAFTFSPDLVDGDGTEGSAYYIKYQAMDDTQYLISVDNRRSWEKRRPFSLEVPTDAMSRDKAQSLTLGIIADVSSFFNHENDRGEFVLRTSDDKGRPQVALNMSVWGFVLLDDDDSIVWKYWLLDEDEE